MTFNTETFIFVIRLSIII